MSWLPIHQLRHGGGGGGGRGGCKHKRKGSRNSSTM